MRKPQADKVLLGAILLLLLFGVVMITSIGVPKSIELSTIKSNVLYPSCTDPRVDCYLLFKRHIIRLAIGMVLFFIMAKIPYRFWKKTAGLWYGLAVFFLLALFIIGRSFTTFARSWLVLFETSIQPTEFAKLALIFYLAHFFERKTNELENFHYGFLPFCIVTGLIAIPVLVQPDLGGFSILAAIAVSMYFIAGARVRYLVIGAMSALFLAFIALNVLPDSITQEYKGRLGGFFSSSETCEGEKSCWQTEQAKIAVGTGGFWGKGLTQGVGKSYWLPQATDDFIFAASSEELGFLRAIIIIFLYAIIAYRGYMVAQNAPDRFSMLVAIGITSWITVQAFVNIGINIGLLPVTGITLPFVSYGGSSLVSTLMGAGVLIQISKYASHNSSPGIYRGGDRRSHHAKFGPYTRN